MLTQHILQQALIKKKLEEQKENYRRKHETGKQVGLEFFVLKIPCFTFLIRSGEIDENLSILSASPPLNIYLQFSPLNLYNKARHSYIFMLLIAGQTAGPIKLKFLGTLMGGRVIG